MIKKAILALSLSLGLAACQSPSSDPRPLVLCTTNILAEVSAQLLGPLQDSIRLQSLMGPGVDPHLYKASQGDLQALSEADLIIYNGLQLEGKMSQILKGMESRAVLAAAEAVPREFWLNATDYPDAYDPHLWQDPLLWDYAVAAISEALQQQFPAYAARIELQSEAYRQRLAQLARAMDSMWQEVPEKQRVLITAHDAFKYYGRRYNLEVRGLQGISTAAEYGIRDLNDLADYAAERGVKAIFVESSVSPRSIEALQRAAQDRGHAMAVGGKLYSDALGGEGSNAETYLSMLEHNTKTMIEALR